MIIISNRKHQRDENPGEVQLWRRQLPRVGNCGASGGRRSTAAISKPPSEPPDRRSLPPFFSGYLFLVMGCLQLLLISSIFSQFERISLCFSCLCVHLQLFERSPFLFFLLFFFFLVFRGVTHLQLDTMS